MPPDDVVVGAGVSSRLPQRHDRVPSRCGLRGPRARRVKAAQLKAYFGWAPRVSQSGTSLWHVQVTSGGQRRMKQIMYLAVWTAIQQTECEWAKLYHRLVPVQCSYHEATRQYAGRAKVMGRIVGQMITPIF